MVFDVLTCLYPLLSFLDRDTLMRHFGHGVGHCEFARQPEVRPETVVDRQAEEIDEDGEEEGGTDTELEQDEEDEGEEDEDGEDEDEEDELGDGSDGDGDNDGDDDGYASF